MRRARRAHAAVVVLAGGSGSRVGAGLNKVYLPLAGRRVVSWSFTWASRVPEVGSYVLVVRPEDRAVAEEAMRREAVGLPVRLVVGGGTRHESEQAALDLLEPQVRSGAVDVIAIHDGARPLAGPALFASVVRTAADVGGAVPSLPARGVMPVQPDGNPLEAPGSTSGLMRVQTPQAFRAPELLEAYAVAARTGAQGTDTSSTVSRCSDLGVRAVPGTRENLKVTYPHDLFLAEQLLAAHRYRLA